MQTEHKRRIIPDVRRIVVKLGSSVVATASGIARDNVGRLVSELARLHQDGYQVVVVTSGARAAGLSRLGLKAMPSTIPEQQAAAAVGQIGLMSLYREFFADFGKHIGQVLLTASDLHDRARYLNAKHTVEHLLNHGVIPVVNENDSVAVDELKFGDNDRLAALVAGLASAELLIALTDVAGVFDGDPGAADSRVIEVLDDLDATGLELSSPRGALGTGGMASKIAAAASAAHRGTTTVIASGLQPGVLARIVDCDDSVGTLLPASQSPISNRKHWIAYGVSRGGSAVLDDGAVEALCKRGSSLLAAGIVAVDGDFHAGECVGLFDRHGREFARGLVAYDSADCERIKGISSALIEATLGYHMGDEVIHRNDLVLLAELGTSRGDS